MHYPLLHKWLCRYWLKHSITNYSWMLVITPIKAWQQSYDSTNNTLICLDHFWFEEILWCLFEYLYAHVMPTHPPRIPTPVVKLWKFPILKSSELPISLATYRITILFPPPFSIHIIRVARRPDKAGYSWAFRLRVRPNWTVSGLSGFW